MAVYFKKPELKRDWAAISEKLGLAALESVTLNIPNVIREVSGAFTDTAKDQTVDEIAWVWLRTSLCAALWSLPRQIDRAGASDATIVKSAIREFADGVMDHMGEVELTRSVMLHPENALVSATAFEALGNYIKVVAPQFVTEPEMLKKQFGIAIRAASARVLALDPGYYEPLRQAMSGPMSEGERQDTAWERHTSWIRHLFERRPIFSPEEDQEFPLVKVYQRLRCYWHEEVEEPSDKNEDGEHRSAGKKTRTHAHVDDLHTNLHTWLSDQSSSTDHIRVVAGGPGSGKSSFARAFALEATETTPFRVIFVELQHMSFSGSFPQKLGEHLTSSARHNEHDPDGSAGFHENPMDWRVHSTDPILLVFDGLDELSSAGSVAKELSRTFIQHVRHYLTTLNASSGGKVRAIILGRSAACEAALAEAGLHKEALIHVAPLKRLTEPGDVGFGQHYGRGDSEQFIHDPRGLRDIDQRDEYWSRWAALTGKDQSSVPEAIKSADLGELNVEPLLLHLLIISGYIGDNWRDAVDNRNHVYQSIFEKIFNRDIKKQHQGSNGLTVAQRFSVLECLGLAAWRGGGRTGDDQEFKSLMSRYAPGLQSKVNDAERLSLKNVAVQFYTRQGEESGFEFIHKSFSEYLTARALLDYGFRSTRLMSNVDDPAQPEVMAKDWVNLIDAAEITEEVIRFLRDEARLPARQPMLAEAKLQLTALMNWTLKNGMPAHEADGGTFRIRETKQRCAETAVLAVLNAVARTGASGRNSDSDIPPHNRIILEWPEESRGDVSEQENLETSASVLLTPRLLIQRLWPKPVPAARLLFSNLSMPNAWLSSMMLASVDLSGADLRGAHLNGAYLSGAYLNGAHLGDAELRGADLSGAHLNGADLREADLTGADLSGADLTGADLSGADLSGAYLNGAYLNGAHLGDADLSGAYLNGAYLNGAHLGDADLSGADLNGANCSRLHINSALLQFAILTKAKHLTQDAVNSAKGSKVTTKLPANLTAPSHWDED